MAAHGLPYHGWRGLLPLLPLPERYFQCTPCSSLCHCLYSNTPESGGTAACLTFFPLIRYAAHCPDQTDEEYRTEFVLWSLTQSPLIVDTDVRNMTTIMKQALLNEELIAIHQSTSQQPSCDSAARGGWRKNGRVQIATYHLLEVASGRAGKVARAVSAGID